jgi:hypothetical protein
LGLECGDSFAALVSQFGLATEQGQNQGKTKAAKELPHSKPRVESDPISNRAVRRADN